MSLQARYTILRKIADGGTAEIFLATQKGVHGFEKTVVLKRIFPAYYADPQFRDMLINEAHIAMSLNHSNIVQVLDLGEADGQYILALELVDGWTLDAVLRRARAARATLPPAIALYLTAEVCRALAYAHAKTGPDDKPLGIVHRDISPHNVLLSEQGEVKLTDFGIATSGTDRRDTGRDKVIKGKIAYMSPEQAAGAALDARSDLFSVGTMLYVMICRRYPFDAPTDLEVLLQVKNGEFIPPETARPGLNPEVYRVLKRAMAKAPADRYQRAEEMLLDVEQVMRVAFRAVGQTELKRWLGDLSARDGVPALTKTRTPETETETGAQAAVETIGDTLELDGVIELSPAPSPATTAGGPGGGAPPPVPPARPPVPMRARTVASAPPPSLATAPKPPPPLAALAVGRRSTRAMPVVAAPSSGSGPLPAPPAPPAPPVASSHAQAAAVAAPIAPSGSGAVEPGAPVPASLTPAGSGPAAPAPPPAARTTSSSIPVPPPLAATATPPPVPPPAAETPAAPAAPETSSAGATAVTDSTTTTAASPPPAATPPDAPVTAPAAFTRRRMTTAALALLGAVVLVILAVKSLSSRRRHADVGAGDSVTATTPPAHAVGDGAAVAPVVAPAATPPPVHADATATAVVAATDAAGSADGSSVGLTVGSSDAKAAAADATRMNATAPTSADAADAGAATTAAVTPPATAAAAPSPTDAAAAGAPTSPAHGPGDADGTPPPAAAANDSRDAGADAGGGNDEDAANAKLRVTLDVTSEPPGARVATAHHSFGVTPVSIHLKPNNTYALTFTHDGYRPLTKHVKIADGPSQEVSVTLRKAPSAPPPRPAATSAPAAPPPPPAKPPGRSWFQQMFSR